MVPTDVLYLGKSGTGWGPIDALVDLCVQTFDAQLIPSPDAGAIGRVRRAAARIPSKPRGDRVLLAIAANPAQIAAAARIQHWLPGYGVRILWIIDSFWTDRAPRFAREGHFDHVFITDKDLVAEWREITGRPVHWLPWGSDTLAVRGAPEKTVDLLRLGRQPEAWDDDDQTAALAERRGLAFKGRPPLFEDGRKNQEVVRAALAEARMVLTFSNLVSPADYVHPTREYLTGRWMDALAAGTIPVGVTPASAAWTLWDGATVEISHSDPEAGLDRLRQFLESEWSPALAEETRTTARRTIDWRLRLAELSSITGQSLSPGIRTELSHLGA